MTKIINILFIPTCQEPKGSGSGEKFSEYLEGVDVKGGIGVEFYVTQDFFRDFISDLAGKGNEHGLGERTLYESFYNRIVGASERNQVLRFRAESQRH